VQVVTDPYEVIGESKPTQIKEVFESTMPFYSHTGDTDVLLILNLDSLSEPSPRQGASPPLHIWSSPPSYVLEDVYSITKLDHVIFAIMFY